MSLLYFSNAVVACIFEFVIIIATGTFAVVYGALKESRKKTKIPGIKYNA